MCEGQRKCEGGKKRIPGENKGSKADEENKRLRGKKRCR